MLTSLSAVFVASLLGSPHCAGMCGPFAALATIRRGPPRRGPGTAIAYNLGRGVAYVALGAIAGLIGLALDRGGTLAGLQHIAGWIAGVTMILVGMASLAHRFGLRAWHGARPARGRRIAGVFGRIGHLEPVPRAFGIGVATSLLPCGWLWVFAIAAAGTGHPGLGAATMAAFWLGTVPMMGAVAGALKHASSRLRAKLPWLGASLVIAVGIHTLASRALGPPLSHPPQGEPAASAASEVPPCHRP